jgi:CheY-like chemotaxis protein
MEKPLATRTPILVVEDNLGMGLRLVTQLFVHRQALEDVGISWERPQICPSGRGTLNWLGRQQLGTVLLIMLDYALQGGTVSLPLVPVMRAHPALNQQAKIIGWSALTDVSAAFFQAGADGFISKQLPPEGIVEHILAVLSHLRAGHSWLALEPPPMRLCP